MSSKLGLSNLDRILLVSSHNKYFCKYLSETMFDCQGLVLVYVTVVLVVMARQFSFLSNLDTEQDTVDKMMVVNTQGVTEIDTVRNVITEYPDLV